MRKGALWALIVTGLLMLIFAIGTGAFALFSWALAMNGFIGQERAVNASIITFAVLGILATLVCIALSLFSVYYFSVKRAWNAAISALLSVLVFSIVSGGLQFVSVMISAVVAQQMRKGR